MLIADLDWSNIAPMIMSLGIFVVLPITALLLRHQRFMAQLIHSKPVVDPAVEDRMRRMESEIAALRDRMNTHILTADPSRTALTDRIEAEQRATPSQ